MKKLFAFALLLNLPATAAENCSWCIVKDAQVNDRALKIAAMPPEKIIAEIEKEKVCIRVLDSGRKVPPGIFHWGQVRPAQGQLSELSKLPSLMGKTLCENEHKLAKDCVTIVLAHDAPKSTLIHEYLHTQQIKKGRDWCAISKKAWTTQKLSGPDHRRMLDSEWDAHRWLWENVEKLNLSLEDKINIASNLMEQAKLRASEDASAPTYLKEKKVEAKLTQWINDYKKQLGI